MGADDVVGMTYDETQQAVVAAAAEAATEAVMDPAEALKWKPIPRLSQERKDKLDAIGFVWSLRSKRIEDHWDLMFRQVRTMQWAIVSFYHLLQSDVFSFSVSHLNVSDYLRSQLVQYKEKHGDCLVPSRYDLLQCLNDS